MNPLIAHFYWDTRAYKYLNIHQKINRKSWLGTITQKSKYNQPKFKHQFYEK